MIFDQVLAYEWMGSSVYQYTVAIIIFFGFAFGFKLFQRMMVRKLSEPVERTKSDWDDAALKVLSTIRPRFYWFIAFYVATRFLELEGIAARAVHAIVIAWVAYQVVIALQMLIQHVIRARFVDEDDRSSEVVASIVTAISTFTLWVIGILFVLSNLGVNVTSLIAGLGIGGIAIALAAQNVLSDLFSSVAIYFDKPFTPGDFISFDSISGTVQKVGIKTTRIKALEGEEIVVPNKDITSARVKNFKRMERRRIVFTFGVNYETPLESLRKIPSIIQSVVEPIEHATFHRAHFNELAQSSFIFEVVYFVESKEYDLYMDIHQRILFGLKEAFDKENIALAYPTQVMKVVNE